jgi:hypothetical protein
MCRVTVSGASRSFGLVLAFSGCCGCCTGHRGRDGAELVGSARSAGVSAAADGAAAGVQLPAAFSGGLPLRPGPLPSDAGYTAKPAVETGAPLFQGYIQGKRWSAREGYDRAQIRFNRVGDGKGH